MGATVEGWIVGLAGACVLVSACGSPAADRSDASLPVGADAAAVSLDAARPIDASVQPMPDATSVDARAPDGGMADSSTADARLPDASVPVVDSAVSDAASGGDNSGVVLATTLDGYFVIETDSDTRIFRAQTFCAGVVSGDEVVFAQSPLGCASNSFLDLRSGQSCSVWCPLGAAEGATVLAAAGGNTFALQLASGPRVYQSSQGCFGILDGDEVVFTSSPLSCFTNTLIDLQSGATCGVSCPLGTADPTTVIAATTDGDLVLESPLWGDRIFTEDFTCLGIFLTADDALLAQSGGTCFSNTVIDLDTSSACDLTCPLGEAYAGTVTAVQGLGTYDIQTAFGTETFTAAIYCTVFMGDHVLFTDSPLSCFTNTFVDLDTNSSCDVTCQ